MNTDRQLMQQALEMIEDARNGSQRKPSEPVITALRERLAQPEQEPVAWADEIIDDLHAQYNTDGIKEIDSGDALIRLDEAIAAVEEAEQRYTAPPQRKPLTDGELADLWYKQSLDWLEFARAIEAKLKERNT